jgi:hypothetical protein
MKKITKYLFLAASLLAFAPLQAMQESAVKEPETECVEKFISACINDKPNLEEIKTISKKYKNEIHEDTVKIVIITLVQTGGDKQFKIIKYLFENFALNISPSGLIAKALDFACSKNHTEIAEYIYEKASINKSK